mgnify:CR=1 FL=1
MSTITIKRHIETEHTINSPDSLVKAVQATGSHYFDPETLRVFGTRVLSLFHEYSPTEYMVGTSDYRSAYGRIYRPILFTFRDGHIADSQSLAEFDTRAELTRWFKQPQRWGVDNTFVRESPDYPDRVQLVDDYTGDVLLEREHGDHAALLLAIAERPRRVAP